MPQSQDPNLLFLGLASNGSNGTNPTDFDRYDPDAESNGRVVGLGRWLR